MAPVRPAEAGLEFAIDFGLFPGDGSLTGVALARHAKSWLRLSLAIACAALVAIWAADIAAAKTKHVPVPRPAPRTDTAAPDPGDADNPGGEGDVSGDGDDMGPADAAGGGDDAAGSGSGDDMDGPGGGVADQPMQLGPDGSPAGPPALQGAQAPNVPVDPNAPPTSFTLAARLTPDGAPITEGLTWRVFNAAPNADGKLDLIGEAHGGSVNLLLKPGTYFVHAAYGRAGATKKITVGGGPPSDSVVLNAGGMRLSALVGKDQPLSASDVNFDIYAPDEDGSEERALVVPNAPAGHIIGLNAGTYHVVCHYGGANAIVRADIRVEAGKLTEAAMYQKAARLTLKLVAEHGGEALANTAWSVVTPSGEDVADFVGAFPSVVLAAGDYTAIAKHDGKIFERNFTVEPGIDRDMEVIASASGEPAAASPPAQ